MAIHSTGSVRIRTGSALVKGVTGNEAFNTNAAAGYLFKLTGEATWYQIAAITNATNLTLSSRYANSSYQTLRSTEHIATITTATKMYSGTLNYYPIIQEAITITASGEEAFTDDGGGVLTGNASPAGSGTINYDTGAWTITLGTNLTATTVMNASYYSGDTRTGLSYQIVTDYTPIHSFPEMSLNDINFAHIYTKGVRMIDAAINGYFSIENYTTEATVVLTTSDLNKIHVFSNTATCTVTLPSIDSNYEGYWAEFRKKGTGDLVINTNDSDTVFTASANQISNTNTTPTIDFVKLLIESSTHFGCNGMYGVWGANIV